MKTFRFLMVFFFCGAVGAAEIVGTVQGKDGKPIANARVKIYTAGMRTGSSPMCPSCWADCAKSTQTDADGNFKIADVSDNLVFRLLVFAKGYAPEFAAKIDPRNGATKVSLAPRDLSSFKPEQMIQGRILGTDHEPVVGAQVAPEYPQKELDPMAITDEEGRFVLTCAVPVQRNQLRIHAEGYASSNVRFAVKEHPPKPIEITVSRGAAVSGHVLENGKARAGISMGLVQLDRSAERFLGEMKATTATDGSFVFYNVPAKEKLVVYGSMESFAGHGAIPVRHIETAEDESTLKLGDLPVQRARKIAGRFMLQQSKTFPEGTRISIGREEAWDSQMLPVSPEGRFEAEGFPEGEMIEIYAPRDYDIQKINRPFDVDENKTEVKVKQEGDVTALEIALEWKDSKTKYEESNRKMVLDQYEEFFTAQALSPEKIAVFVTAKRKQWDAMLKWNQDGGKGSYKAVNDEAEKIFVSEMKPVLGEQVCAKYVEFEDLEFGRSTVKDLMEKHPGDWLTAEEKAALMRSLSHALKRYQVIYAAGDHENPTLEEKLKETESEFEMILGASAEVLPPAKLAIVRELIDTDKKQAEEEIRKLDCGQ